MKKYPKYRDSEVDWISGIPESWEISKLKFLSDGEPKSFIDGDWIESDIITNDGIRYITTGNIGPGFYKEQGQGYISEQSFTDLNCTEVFPGDLLISRLSPPVGRSCIIPELGCRIVTSVDNVILRPKKTIHRGYLNFFFNHIRYQEWNDLISRGTTLNRISRTMLGNNPVLVPPSNEQVQIVSYLDQKTSLIDDLIQKKLRKIELLQEQRWSIINQAVTKGLNPKVNMKDSGERLIGSIPSHWDITRLKYLVSFDSGYAFKSEDYSTDGVNLIRIGNLYENILDLERSPIYLPISFIEKYPSFVVKKNDILISLTGTLGKKDYGYSIVYDKEFPSMLNQRVGRLKVFNEGVLFQFLTYQLLCDVFLNQLFLKPTGTKQGNFSGDDILTNYLPMPTISEQKEIVEFLNTKTSEIDKQVDLENRKIELLKEYRQSLISEVVTGKIDVRTN